VNAPAHIDHVRLAAGTYFVRVTRVSADTNDTVAMTQALA
jgi:hypothetical protein